jgi:hypothetical protein
MGYRVVFLGHSSNGMKRLTVTVILVVILDGFPSVDDPYN